MPAVLHRPAHFERAIVAKPLIPWVHWVLAVGSVLEISGPSADHARANLMTSWRDKLYVVELEKKAVTVLVIRTLNTSSWTQTLGRFLHSSISVPNSCLTLSRVSTFQTECDLPAGERGRTMDGGESRPRGPHFRWDQSNWALWVGRPECRVFPGCGEGWGTGRTCTGSHFTPSPLLLSVPRLEGESLVFVGVESTPLTEPGGSWHEMP